MQEAVVDRKNGVVGYCFLRRGAVAHDSDTSSDASPPDAIDFSMLPFIEHVFGNVEIAICVGSEFLADAVSLPVDASRLVIEVDDDVTADAATRARLAALHARGCRLAIDARRWSEDWGRVRRLFSVVRVDGDALLRIGGPNDLRVLSAHGARLLAYGVETRVQYEALHALGVEFFQGRFFSRPEHDRKDPYRRDAADFLRLVSQMHTPGIRRSELSRLISKDANLSHRFLSLANSPWNGGLSEVRSLEQAVPLIGTGRTRAWVTLIAMSGLDDAGLEHCEVALVRAHMCERIARETNCGDPDEAFTVGLLSVLEVLLDVPMGRILADLQLTYQVSIALVRRSGVYGLLLDNAVAFESGDRKAVRIGVEPAQLAEQHEVAKRAALHAMKFMKAAPHEIRTAHREGAT